MAIIDSLQIDGERHTIKDTVYTHPSTHPASMISGLATVATSGSYNDLSNKPTIDNNNQTIKSGTTAFGANAAISLTAGSNITLTPDTTNNKITITATDTVYSLPTASSQTLGGVKVGTNLSISNGVLSATNTTYSTFVKSGSTAAAGLVPKPSTTAGTTKYLREDGTWQVPPDNNTTYSAATTSTAGLMSAADKTKLNGIATSANNYSLPTASSSTLGGIKVGTNLSISNGVLSATNTTYSVATTSANGLMSAADKTKLNGIATGATANSGTVTSVAVKMNGSVKGTITSSGTIDLGTVATSSSGGSDKLISSYSSSSETSVTLSKTYSCYIVAMKWASWDRWIFSVVPDCFVDSSYSSCTVPSGGSNYQSFYIKKSGTTLYFKANGSQAFNVYGIY